MLVTRESRLFIPNITITQIRSLLLNWAEIEVKKSITNKTAFSVRQYYRDLKYLDKNLPEIEKLMELVQQYFPVDFNEKIKEDIFTTEALNKDYESLIKILTALADNLPGMRKPYQDAFKNQVMDYFLKINNVLSDLTKNLKEPENIPAIHCDNFLEFSYQFASLKKPDVLPNIKNEQKPIRDAFDILDHCVTQQKSLFLDLVRKANLLRTYLELEQKFEYCKTKLKQQNGQKIWKIKEDYDYTNEKILEAQFNFIIKSIIGDYFVNGVARELQLTFPDLKEDIIIEHLYDSCGKEKINKIKNIADSFDYIVPPKDKSVIDIYNDNYKENTWIKLKNDIPVILSTNFISKTFKNTWIKLIVKNKIPKKEDANTIIKSNEFIDLKKIDKTTAKTISDTKNLSELTEVIKPKTINLASSSFNFEASFKFETNGSNHPFFSEKQNARRKVTITKIEKIYDQDTHDNDQPAISFRPKQSNS